MQLKSKQQGLSIISLVLWAAVIGFVVIFAAKMIPAVSEWRAIDNAVRKAAAEQATAVDAIKAYEASAAVDGISSLRGTDLDIAKNGNELTIKYAYEKRFEVYEPLFIVLDFKGEHKPKASGSK